MIPVIYLFEVFIVL